MLVAPPLTTAQAAEVGDWFGAVPVLRRYPDAVVHATAGTAQHMAAQNSPEFRTSFWDKVFPG